MTRPQESTQGNPETIRAVRIAAVVVSHSHDETFPLVIAALRGQSRKLDGIIVVNQGDNAAIRSWLAGQADLTVITQENAGSAGGFCRGIKESIQGGFDWTWVFDDDAIPQPNALEELVNCPYFRRRETVFVASRIVDRSGRTYMSPGGSTSQAWYDTVLQDKCIEAADGCWPGLLVSAAAVFKAGLPVADFFFYEEDREFITRIARYGKGYCVLSSVVRHLQGSDKFEPFGKDFRKAAYHARNRIARHKLDSGPAVVKTLRVVRESMVFVSRVLRGELPARIVPWILKGALVFKPRIDYLKPGPVRESDTRPYEDANSDTRS